jgi:hypothetical protein
MCMTACTRNRPLSATELFALRTSELADRVSQGRLPFIDAVDMAYSAAQWSGLVDAIGDDAVQKIMAAAFGSVQKAEK